MGYSLGMMVDCTSSSSEEAFAAYYRAVEARSFNEDPHPRFLAVHDDLVARYPCITESDRGDSIWNSGPLIHGFGSQVAGVGFAFSDVERGLPFVVEVAMRHGVVVLDPQTDTVYRPEDPGAVDRAHAQARQTGPKVRAFGAQVSDALRSGELGAEAAYESYADRAAYSRLKALLRLPWHLMLILFCFSMPVFLFASVLAIPAFAVVVSWLLFREGAYLATGAAIGCYLLISASGRLGGKGTRLSWGIAWAGLVGLGAIGALTFNARGKDDLALAMVGATAGLVVLQLVVRLILKVTRSVAVERGLVRDETRGGRS